MKIMSRRGIVSWLPVIFALAVLASGCAARQPELKADGFYHAELKAGGLYSIDDGEGSFRIVKLLVLDDDAAHVAMYRDKFSTRPTTVDPASLSFGGVEDGNEDVGIMHLPLSREAFLRDRPVFISQTPVTEEELEGYQMWKEAGGEVFP
ncbi:MAG TPA: hypothetical protein VEZ40_09930 [Pyrinomonadaceae bacterium]|nr:hypothetical protein [Pyrinomonadaceae bacterium]